MHVNRISPPRFLRARQPCGFPGDGKDLAWPTSRPDDGAMTDDVTEIRDRHLRCRRFIYREGIPGEAEPDVVPADMCRTPVGVIHVLDCPVWLGRHCRFFETREGEPEPHTMAEVESLRAKLRRDYLRWRYRRRTQDLRSAVEAETEPETAEGDDADDTEIVARPEVAPARGARQPRFPGDAPSGPPPRPVEEVDLDDLPEIRPGDVEGDDKP
jgi:hypothetical protein